MKDLDEERSRKQSNMKQENQIQLEKMDKMNKKRLEHVKYFHEHLLKYLQKMMNKNKETYTSQLNIRIQQIEDKGNRKIDEINKKHENQNRSLNTNTYNIRYFNDFIMKRYINSQKKILLNLYNIHQEQINKNDNDLNSKLKEHEA
jgi:hypothetical protein